MSTPPNRAFNNQIQNDANTYFVTQELKKKIAAQMQGKPPQEQEAIIETLLKLLDVNLLVALQMAYSITPKDETQKGV